MNADFTLILEQDYDYYKEKIRIILVWCRIKAKETEIPIKFFLSEYSFRELVKRMSSKDLELTDIPGISSEFAKMYKEELLEFFKESPSKNDIEKKISDKLNLTKN